MKRFVKSPAQVLAQLWAGTWMLYFISESLAWRAVIPETRLWIALGILFVLLAIVPRRWERTGGALLIICGLGLLLAYDIWPPRQLSVGLLVTLELLLAVPPLLSGLLFLSGRVQST